MQTTLGFLKQIEGSIRALIALSIPMKDAYKLARLVKAVATELEIIENLRVQLIRKYGTANSDGTVEVAPENVEAFMNEISPLLNESFEHEFEPIDISSINGNITTSAMLDLIMAGILKENTDAEASS